eukprot:jgi/Mesvir1/24633/Mv21942-RA.1
MSRLIRRGCWRSYMCLTASASHLSTGKPGFLRQECFSTGIGNFRSGKKLSLSSWNEHPSDGNAKRLSNWAPTRRHLSASSAVVPEPGAFPCIQDKDLVRTRAFVGGSWVAADREESTFAVKNPATGDVLATVASLGTREVEHAIAAASDALPAWRSSLAVHRAAIMKKWYEAILGAKEDLAVLMTLEQGKPLAEARGEVDYGASFVEWFAEEAKRVDGDILQLPLPGRRGLVLKQAVGVVAAITPWNFPLAMITRKVSPAIAAGCTVVIKPSEETPLTALALARLAERAGVPPGVINVVTGDSSTIGKCLLESPVIKKIGFTGSTGVGKYLMAGAAASVKKVSLELGGHAPFLVFDDADLEAAANGAVASKFRNSGQTCICTNRILVQEGVYDKFAELFAKKVAALKMGNGLDEGVTQGPLINERAMKRMIETVEDARQQGGTILTGGSPAPLGGLFFEPTVIRDAHMAMRVCREETFGPLAPLIKFKTEEEAIDIANDTNYGLSAYFYTRDYARTWRVAEALEFGMVGCNESLMSNAIAPFGGMKESGIGREGSKYGISEFLETKYVCIGGIGK